jgi:hypothetical protein
MNATIALSNRIAAGVTAEYVRDLTRRPAQTPGAGRRVMRERRGVSRAARRRGDCEERQGGAALAGR